MKIIDDIFNQGVWKDFPESRKSQFRKLFNELLKLFYKEKLNELNIEPLKFLKLLIDLEQITRKSKDELHPTALIEHLNTLDLQPQQKQFLLQTFYRKMLVKMAEKNDDYFPCKEVVKKELKRLRKEQLAPEVVSVNRTEEKKTLSQPVIALKHNYLKIIGKFVVINNKEYNEINKDNSTEIAAYYGYAKRTADALCSVNTNTINMNPTGDNLRKYMMRKM